MATTKYAPVEAAAPVVELFKQGQDNVLKAVQTWSESVQKLVPDTLAFAPKSDQLPTPKEVVDGAYDFAERVLSVQRSFAHGVVEAWAPVLGIPAQVAEVTQDAVKG